MSAEWGRLCVQPAKHLLVRADRDGKKAYWSHLLRQHSRPINRRTRFFSFLKARMVKQWGNQNKYPVSPSCAVRLLRRKGWFGADLQDVRNGRVIFLSRCSRVTPVPDYPWSADGHLLLVAQLCSVSIIRTSSASFWFKGSKTSVTLSCVVFISRPFFIYSEVWVQISSKFWQGNV